MSGLRPAAHDRLGADPNIQVAFWESVKAVGYLPDQLGMSYYPTDGKTTFGAADMFAFFKNTATALGQRFNRQMFIAEYGYPSSLMQSPYSFNDPVPGYQQTEAGQRDFTHDLLDWGISSGRLAGIRPWDPDYCSSSAWQPMSWFDVSNNRATREPVLSVAEEVVPQRPASCTGAAGPKPLRVIARFYGRSHGLHRLLLRLSTSSGELSDVTIELRHGGHVVVRRRVAHLDTHTREIVLHPNRRLARGRYTLVVRHTGSTLIDRLVNVG